MDTDEIAKPVNHPLFARLYMRMPAGAEEAERRELLSGAFGTVIEVGCGHGLNFPFYPSDVTRVMAVEPEPRMRAAAIEAAARAPVPIEVVDGLAADLRFPDASFDFVIASLMLCSVPDQAGALAEMRRVLKPGGSLRFYEHVVSRGRIAATAQRMLDRSVWPRVAGGCNLSRDTERAISEAGFEIETLTRSRGPAPLMFPHVLGTARRA